MRKSVIRVLSRRELKPVFGHRIFKVVRTVDGVRQTYYRFIFGTMAYVRFGSLKEIKAAAKAM